MTILFLPKSWNERRQYVFCFNKSRILVEDIQDIKLVATSMKQQREEKKPLKSGDGFLVLNGKLRRMRRM